MEAVLERIKEDLTKQEVEINGVIFHFDKLSAWDGFPIAEKIRFALAGPLTTTSTGSDNMFLATVLKIKPEDLRGIARDLFPHVKFRKAGSKDSFVKLADAEDMAFGQLEVIDVYEVILRAIGVNFSNTIVGIVSRSVNLVPDLLQ